MSLNSSDEALLDASENASQNNASETENKEIVWEIMEQILNKANALFQPKPWNCCRWKWRNRIKN